LGTIAVVVGLDKAVPIIDFLLANLDTVSASVLALAGFVTALFGFFKNKERFEIRAETTNTDTN
jgi:hypothetical protein